MLWLRERRIGWLSRQLKPWRKVERDASEPEPEYRRGLDPVELGAHHRSKCSINLKNVKVVSLFWNDDERFYINLECTCITFAPFYLPVHCIYIFSDRDLDRKRTQHWSIQMDWNLARRHLSRHRRRYICAQFLILQWQAESCMNYLNRRRQLF